MMAQLDILATGAGWALMAFGLAFASTYGWVLLTRWATVRDSFRGAW